MLVVLNLYDGQVFRQKIWLRDSQVARVGSTEWADFSVGTDPHMSGVHFLIAVTEKGCLLRDLSSRNGTLVNGERIIRQRLLSHGDLILAGKTMFSIEVDDQIPDWMLADECPPEGITGTTLVSEKSNQIAVPPDRSRYLGELPGLPYTRDRLESGVSVFRSLSADESATSLLKLLTAKPNSYFVINMSAFTKLSMIPFFSRVEMVNDSIGIVEVQDPADVEEIVNTSWGKDATVFVQSSLDATTIAAHVLSVISAFQHPSVLRHQLLSAPNLYVSKLMRQLDAVVVERSDGDSWELYSLSDDADDWERLGLPDAPLQRGSSADSATG